MSQNITILSTPTETNSCWLSGLNYNPSILPWWPLSRAMGLKERLFFASSGVTRYSYTSFIWRQTPPVFFMRGSWPEIWEFSSRESSWLAASLEFYFLLDSTSIVSFSGSGSSYSSWASSELKLMPLVLVKCSSTFHSKMRRSLPPEATIGAMVDQSRA